MRGDGVVHIERRRVLVLLHPGKRAAVEMLTELAPWLEERFEHVAIVSDVLSFAERHRASRTGTGTATRQARSDLARRLLRQLRCRHVP